MSNIPQGVEKLITMLKATGKKYDIEKIENAYEYARALHEGQFRASGEEYISHPIAVAEIVAQLGLEYGVPVTYGMITAENLDQAIERSGTKAGNKGVDAALAAIEMANLTKAIN